MFLRSRRFLSFIIVDCRLSFSSSHPIIGWPSTLLCQMYYLWFSVLLLPIRDFIIDDLFTRFIVLLPSWSPLLCCSSKN